MSAADIALTLDGRREGRAWRCRCPVHGGRSLVVSDGHEGRLLVKCWAGCPSRDVLAELRRHGLIDGAAGGDDASPDPTGPERRRNAEARRRRQRIALARDMVAQSLPAVGTVVERYLRAACGVLGTAPIPQSIHYLPMASPYAWHPPSGGRRPVMLAAVEHVEIGLAGVHRTWLAVDGSGKASLEPVRISTGVISGGAVHLAPARDELLVAEGIETTLSGIIATGLPGWAALSTSGLVALVLPPIVRSVIILADHDGDVLGAAAFAIMTACRRRLQSAASRRSLPRRSPARRMPMSCCRSGQDNRARCHSS
jgi:putative DNA primase/helicase